MLRILKHDSDHLYRNINILFTSLGIQKFLKNNYLIWVQLIRKPLNLCFFHFIDDLKKRKGNAIGETESVWGEEKVKENWPVWI